MNSHRFLPFLPVFVIWLLTSCTKPGEVTLERVNAYQHLLPAGLSEASGIAVMPDQTVLLHDDETGIIYRLNLDDYRLSEFARLGLSPVDDDFEGIAIKGDAVYLTNSTGKIYITRTNPVSPGKYTTIDANLENVCEFEGLAYHEEALLMPCKTDLKGGDRNLVIYAFNPATMQVEQHFSIQEEVLGGIEGPYPTAIEVWNDNYYVISTNHLLVIDSSFQLVNRYELPTEHHFQPEGIGILSDGRVVIVDDNRKGRSYVTTYPGLPKAGEGFPSDPLY